MQTITKNHGITKKPINNNTHLPIQKLPLVTESPDHFRNHDLQTNLSI